jgi:hypothetical protein
MTTPFQHLLWFIPDNLEDLEVLEQTRASNLPSKREAKIRKELEIY